MSMNVNSPTRTRNVDSKKAKAVDAKKFSPCTLSRTNDKMRQQAEASKVRHRGLGLGEGREEPRDAPPPPPQLKPDARHPTPYESLQPELYTTPSHPSTRPSIQRKRTGGAKKVEKKTRATPVARRTVKSCGLDLNGYLVWSRSQRIPRTEAGRPKAWHAATSPVLPNVATVRIWLSYFGSSTKYQRYPALVHPLSG